MNLCLKHKKNIKCFKRDTQKSMKSTKNLNVNEGGTTVLLPLLASLRNK